MPRVCEWFVSLPKLSDAELLGVHASGETWYRMMQKMKSRLEIDLKKPQNASRRDKIQEDLAKLNVEMCRWQAANLLVVQSAQALKTKVRGRVCTIVQAQQEAIALLQGATNDAWEIMDDVDAHGAVVQGKAMDLGYHIEAAADEAAIACGLALGNTETRAPRSPKPAD